LGTPVMDIMVPTHNHIELTIKSINALYRNTFNPFHLIIVDDSTDNMTPYYGNEVVSKEHPDVTFIHSDIPYKCGNQFFNIALENCKTEYMVTVMNSICVEPDWEIVALELMKNDPQVGVIGFKCLFPWGLIESAGIQMGDGKHMPLYTPCDLGRDLPGHQLSKVYECVSVQWAFAMLRKRAVIGNLDETLFHGFRGWDDIDDSFVVKSKGWKILYDGLGVGYHEPRATRGNDSDLAAKENMENAHVFFKRWGFWEEYLRVSGQPITDNKALNTVLV
jgi:GT2 family glycosyltransferase